MYTINKSADTKKSLETYRMHLVADNLSIAEHALPMLMLLLVDEVVLLRYMNLSTNFRDLPFNDGVALIK